jgi:hypothetical protein
MHISPSQDIHGTQPVLKEKPEKDIMLWLAAILLEPSVHRMNGMVT